MIELLSNIGTNWPIVVAFVGAAFWLARLESRSLSNEREFRRLWEQRREDLQDAVQNRQRVLTMLDRMEMDIKRILEHMPRG